MARFSKLKGTITGGAMIIALFSVFSRILGLLRDRLLSSSFGAGRVLDAYYASFRLPDLIFNTLILGALSSAFIPIFLKYWQKDKEEAWRITNSVLNILLLIVLGLATLAFFLAPTLIRYLVPGFDLETQTLTVSLTRIMLIGILFFTCSNIASSVLNSFRRFLVYSLAPLMYNLGIIFGIMVLVPHTSLGLKGLAWGVTLGAAGHFLIQLPALLKTGYRWQPIISSHQAIKKIVKLMLPRCFGLAVSQLNFVVTTLVASTLTVGAVAIYSLAFNLFNVPIGIFGISLAIAIFPVLSGSFAQGDQKTFVSQMSKTVQRIIYLIVPITILYLSLRAQIVRLILGAGVFSWRDTVLTATTLGFFSLSLLAQSLIPLFSRAFYSLHDTLTPVKIAVVSFGVNIVGCFLLGRWIGVGGLALAFSLASFINLILLYYFFHKKALPLPNKKIRITFLRAFGLSAIMLVIVQLSKGLFGSLVNMQTFVGVLIQTVVSGSIGLLFYFVASLFLHFPEVDIIKQFFKRK
ncbi:murein biosynthesis integral membrane protein MurJ [Patescibacteria group bacterium]|nr:murein biosynthesis integral membrane protein MurJ [Patescibacteria group bacterium]